jgi:hypothetical protein
MYCNVFFSLVSPSLFPPYSFTCFRQSLFSSSISFNFHPPPPVSLFPSSFLSIVTNPPCYSLFLIIHKYMFRQLLMTWHIKFSQLHVWICSYRRPPWHVLFPPVQSSTLPLPPPLSPVPSPPQKTFKIKIGFLIIASPHRTTNGVTSNISFSIHPPQPNPTSFLPSPSPY